MYNHFLTCFIHLKRTSSYHNVLWTQRNAVTPGEGTWQDSSLELLSQLRANFFRFSLELNQPRANFFRFQLNVTIPICIAFSSVNFLVIGQLSAVNYYFPARFQLLCSVSETLSFRVSNSVLWQLASKARDSALLSRCVLQFHSCH